MARIARAYPDSGRPLRDRPEAFNSFVNEPLDRVERWRRRLPSVPDTSSVHPLSHGVKENLVERVLDWPGVHAAQSILEDKPLTGYWFDRTQEYAARNRG